LLEFDAVAAYLRFTKFMAELFSKVQFIPNAGKLKHREQIPPLIY